MTVETSSAQNTSRPAAPTESKHARGKPGGDNHGATGMGGFMAILASLDSSELAGTGTALAGDVALAASDAAAAAMAASGRTADALKALRTLGASVQSELAKRSDGLSDLDATAVLATDIDKLLQGIEGEGVAAALLCAPDPTLAPTDLLVPAGAPQDPAALLAQAAQWGTPAVPGTETAHPNAVGGVLPNTAAQVTSTVKPEDATPFNAAADAVVLEPLGKSAKAQRDASARLASLQAALAEPTQTGSHSDFRQTVVPQKLAEAPMTPIATALAAATTTAPTRRDDSERARSVFRPNGSENTAVSPTYQPSAAGAAAPNAVQAPTPTDMYVAEKVAYWISNDVQNAEMKLDGIGENPVEVSIRMQGNEAHISFRSDEQHARAALENASEHLKDLLQREGLVLSGVSVGTSGSGDAAEQERRSRQGTRPSGIALVQPAQADRIPGAGRASGGALDLFV